MTRSLLTLFAIVLLAGGAAAQEPAATTAPAPTVLVTGANRGIGLEFARQYAAAGATVIGTARRPEAAAELNALGVRVERLDVTDAASVAALAKRLDGMALDLVINNAGIGNRTGTLETLDADRVRRTFEVNCLGPMRVTQALLPNLRKGRRKQVVNISSGLGSIGNNTSGAYYGYRESKAGLNMFTRTLAAQLREEGFTCIAMSPGWVRTDMGGESATLSPAESISGMRRVIEGLTPERSGSFLNHDGTELPW